MTLTKNKYYFEALDYYPYNLAECVEALSYALSYDPDDADSLCLMGRIYSETLKDYETAKQYFEEALQNNINNVNTPKYYIDCLLNNEDLDDAERMIEFALKIKGIDKAEIFYSSSLLYERKKEYEKALSQLEEAKDFSYNKNMTDFLEDRVKFIKEKNDERLNKQIKIEEKKTK